MSALASSHGGGIDLTKVRELMGDMRIDQLPPGARDLMQTVEQQSQLRQALASGTTVSTTAEESQLSSHRSHHSNLSHSPAPATMEPSASSTGPQSQALPSSGGGMTPPRAPSLSPQEDPYGTRSSGGESQFPQYQHQHRGSYSSIFSDSSVTSPLATGDPNQPVTREDLRLLESRIMHAIDRKISQLEERIMAKLYARNRL
ncbi:hypothetical protein BGZ73_003038 [Actinomortierella ambigua]|nr:hypothetical protein BGZ73_003038 [Actinomortierella ambigua]